MSDAAGLGVPTAYQLRGALLVARLIPPSGARYQDLHLAYQELPWAGSFHVLDLKSAEALLERWDLVVSDGEWLRPAARLLELVTDDDSGACEMLAAEALASLRPPWLGAAVTGTAIATELLPDHVAMRLTAAIPDPDRREAVLLAAGRIADDAHRREVGEIGEELVVALARAELHRLGRPDLADRVVRLSLRSDQLGYDVRVPRLSGGVWRVEVKSSSRHALALEFFISRGEVETGRRLSDWVLAMCHVSPGGDDTVVGWCRYGMIDPLLPQDKHAHGSWQTARIRAHPDLFEPGLPPLDA